MLILKNITTNSVENAVGKGLGFAVHGEETEKALKRQGVSFNDDAPVILHQLPAFAMKKVKGKINILYTAFETMDLPDAYVEGAEQADLIICVSDFVKEAFKKKLPNKLIVTVPLGVDSNVFNYTKRMFNEPFIFLWVGAPDSRKGFDLILEAWEPFYKRKDCLLVLKTTGRDTESTGNVIIEGKKFTVEDMAKLYQMAHCFIFPSFAEGFGLPLAEAMSTGLPCIFTPYGGVNQFADRKNAYPVSYRMVPVDYGTASYGAQANIKDIREAIVYIHNNYDRAVVRGKNARRTIENKFTWDDTGRKLKKIIEEFVRYGTLKSN